MTPLECAQGIADYLKTVFADYGNAQETDAEKLAEIREQMKAETDEEALAELKATENVIQQNHDEPINIYAGYLPYTSRKTANKLCPAMAVRPSQIVDGENETTALMSVFVSTYDEDMLFGADSLFHLLERVREEMLAHDPVKNKWKVKPGTMRTVIPDEQPYPQWLGLVEFDVYLPQPENHSFMNNWG